MLEFTLKFLSGESRKYEVEESTTVRQFKERLREELTIPIERQRLIFQGKVLQDDTKLSDSNIQNKTVHFVERAEPIPPTPNNSTGATANASGFGGAADGGMNQAMMDEVNETTSIFINAFPGAANLQPNDIQGLVQNLLNDLGDVGRQAQVNTTMASDGHGVDINIDFGNVNQFLEQQEINERFRSIGRMLTRLKLRIDRIEQIVESNFRLSPTPPPPPPSQTTTTAERPTTPPRPSASATVPLPSSTPSTTFLGMEDITSSEMDAESQGSVQSTETLHTPPSTNSTTPADPASTPTANNPPAPTAPRTARDLAELMGTINTEQQRLQRHYQAYLRTIVQSDPFDQEMTGRQRFYSLYNEATHLLAHIDHNITDISLDLNDPIDTRVLHLGELPISQANLASVVQNGAAGPESASREASRVSRPMGRRPGAMATTRFMGPIQIQAGANPAMMPGDVRMQFQNPMAFPRMVFNAPTRPGMPFRPPAPLMANNGGMQQSMRFNLGTLPYTFMQMGPEGITLNQVSASVVADVQTSESSSPGQQPPGNRPAPGMNPQPGATHVISSGPIQLNGGQFDANTAAELAQRLSSSVQQQIAQMVNQQMPGGHGQPMNNQNMNAAGPILRPTLVLQPDAVASTRASEALRSRSADSRPLNSTASASTAASSAEDDDADWVDVPMDMPMPPQAIPPPPMFQMPRLRGPAIIQSIDRSLPCTSPYFTQTLRPPFDNANNASNITPNEAAALNNAAGRTVIFASAPQRPRGRHRHPAGPWAQQVQQQQQQQQQQMPNFMFGAPAANMMTAAGQPYNVTAHSFEIPMVISTSTTTEIPTASLPNNNGQTPTNNDGQQGQMNTIISQVLSQILPGVLRSGNGRVRLNIGQNNPNENAPAAPSQGTATTPTPPATGTPNTANIPGVMAGGLDFSQFARSIGSMVQGMAGRLIPGAALATPPASASSPSAPAATAPSSSTTPRPATNANDTDVMTEQMLGELLRLLGGGLDNPELENLTIGSFMQRFGEDIDARSNDGTNLISELFSAMTARMRFTDVWNLVLGNAVGPRINEARQSATEYLRTTVLRGRAVTPETLDEIADRLYESLLREASVNFSELRVKPNINIANVIKRFFRHHARKLLNILFEDADNVWFDRFRQQLLAMRNEYLALSAHCLEGGESAAVDFVLNRHRIIFRSTNQMIVTWSETYLRTALTTAFNAVRTSPPSISVYLVEPPPVVDRPAPAARAMPRTDRERETAAATAITTTSNPSLQGNLPEDWIPIVVRDVNTQRDAPAQPPFSDAYKDGMPAKRRRVHLREDLTTSNLLQTLVHRASSSTSAASAESVLSGESASPVLVETFEQELKRLLEQRVRQDRDYPEVKQRMPNTKRYLDGDQ